MTFCPFCGQDELWRITRDVYHVDGRHTTTSRADIKACLTCHMLVMDDGHGSFDYY